jgi:hypothetical protein
LVDRHAVLWYSGLSLYQEVPVARKPSYEDGHLVVAAVRVLSRKAAKPPTPEDIADLLGLASEFVRSLVMELGNEGILRVVVNPFEIRAEVADHLKLEELPRETEAPTIQAELDDFMERRKKKVEETEKMFSSDEMEKTKRDKISKFDDELKRLKGKPKPPHLR